MSQPNIRDELSGQVCCNAQLLPAGWGTAEPSTFKPPVPDEPIRRSEWNKAPPNGLRRRNSGATPKQGTTIASASSN